MTLKQPILGQGGTEDWCDSNSPIIRPPCKPGHRGPHGLFPDFGSNWISQPIPLAPVKSRSWIAKHSSFIKTTVAFYNLRMIGIDKSIVPMPMLDEDIIRAMMLKEGGITNGSYPGVQKHDPMQVANKGDNALMTLREKPFGTPDSRLKLDREKAAIIATNKLRKKLNKFSLTPYDSTKKRWDYASITNPIDADSSIEAGIVWLIFNAADFKFVNFDSPTGKLKTYTIAKGDNASRIARNQNTTLDSMKTHNPGVDLDRLSIGKKLKLWVPATMLWKVKSWNSWEKAIKDYNGSDHKDTYGKKVLEYIKMIKADPTKYK